MKMVEIDREFIHRMGTRRQKRTLFKNEILWLRDQNFPFLFGSNKRGLIDVMTEVTYYLQRMFDESD